GSKCAKISTLICTQHGANMPTYVNNMNFHDGKTMHRRGEINTSPKKEHIQRGMVRAVKINPPSEVKDARRKKRKSKNTAKRNTKLDERSDSQSGDGSGTS